MFLLGGYETFTEFVQKHNTVTLFLYFVYVYIYLRVCVSERVFFASAYCDGIEVKINCFLARDISQRWDCSKRERPMVVVGEGRRRANTKEGFESENWITSGRVSRCVECQLRKQESPTKPEEARYSLFFVLSSTSRNHTPRYTRTSASFDDVFDVRALAVQYQRNTGKV